MNNKMVLLEAKKSRKVFYDGKNVFFSFSRRLVSNFQLNLRISLESLVASLLYKPKKDQRKKINIFFCLRHYFFEYFVPMQCYLITIGSWFYYPIKRLRAVTIDLWLICQTYGSLVSIFIATQLPWSLDVALHVKSCQICKRKINVKQIASYTNVNHVEQRLIMKLL